MAKKKFITDAHNFIHYEITLRNNGKTFNGCRPLSALKALQRFLRLACLIYNKYFLKKPIKRFFSEPKWFFCGPLRMQVIHIAAAMNGLFLHISCLFWRIRLYREPMSQAVYSIRGSHCRRMWLNLNCNLVISWTSMQTFMCVLTVTGSLGPWRSCFQPSWAVMSESRTLSLWSWMAQVCLFACRRKIGRKSHTRSSLWFL